MATSFDEPLAHANGIGEGIGLVCDGRENEVAERMIVEIVEAMAKRTREYALVVGRHRADALADIARRYHATTFTQDARRATIIDHSDDRGDLAAHVEQRADGGGCARATTYDDGIRSIHGTS